LFIKKESAVSEKVFLGGLAVAIMLVAYGVQFWKTYVGKSEPHPITWVGFGFLTGVGFLVQWHEGAGAGSWVMGWTAIFCFAVAAMSLWKKRNGWHWSDFTAWDWTALISGGGLFALYLISKNLSWGSFVSAILATSADVVLYWPTFRKAWLLPEKENATAYGLNSFKFIPSLLAMSAYSTETCLYPVAMVIVNAAVVVYLLWRRKCLSLSV
jgi:hypothetical protein